MKWYGLLCILLMFACQSAVETNQEKETDFPGLIKKMDAYLADIGLNGTLLMAEKGAIIYQRAQGVQDVRTGKQLEIGTSFYLASVAKQMTAMTLLMLDEDGTLSLDDSLSDFFPELPYADSIQIRHLLTHTSGIPDYYTMGKFHDGMTNAEVVQALLEQPQLDFTPGSAYSYSNSAYVLLSMITAKASGMSYREFVQQRIFDPLEMRQSVVFDETQPEIPNRAVGFTAEGEVADYDAYTTGGGGIFSTVGDVLKWERALYTEKLISQDLMRQAYMPVSLTNGEVSYYGYGWRLVEGMPERVLHTGGLAGFRTILLRDLETEWMLIILTNNTNENLEELSGELYEMHQAAANVTE